eukprot:1188447-Prorocentrum_minimum.AAC.4
MTTHCLSAISWNVACPKAHRPSQGASPVPRVSPLSRKSHVGLSASTVKVQQGEVWEARDCRREQPPSIEGTSTNRLLLMENSTGPFLLSCLHFKSTFGHNIVPEIFLLAVGAKCFNTSEGTWAAMGPRAVECSRMLCVRYEFTVFDGT